MIMIQLINHTLELTIIINQQSVSLMKTKDILINLNNPGGVILHRIYITYIVPDVLALSKNIKLAEIVLF